MNEKIKKLLENWYKINNGHTSDDNQFYDFVIATKGEKIDEIVFCEFLKSINPNIEEDEMSKIYIRYEDLYGFLMRINK